MKRNFLTTTLLSISLLSLNLATAGNMKCTGGVCMVDLSKNFSSIKKKEIKKDIYEYKTVLVDNMETIIFPHSKYVMTEDELAEYDLEQMQKSLLAPALGVETLPSSEYFCEDNLKAVEVVGEEDTYECT
jgi:hypothetical protein